MSKNLTIDYVFKEVELKIVREFIETNHYSKNVNGCKVSFCFALYDNKKLVGAMLFGELSTTAWKKYADNEKEVIELRRLVTLDKCPRNTESWFISKAIKYLKENSNYKICVSYADPYYGHVGYIYQATNWNYEGITNSDILLRTPEKKLYHSRALRTKYKGELKPFAKRLNQLKEKGLLEEIEIPGKHIYTYRLDRKQKPNGKTYPKLKI